MMHLPSSFSCPCVFHSMCSYVVTFFSATSERACESVCVHTVCVSSVGQILMHLIQLSMSTCSLPVLLCVAFCAASPHLRLQPRSPYRYCPSLSLEKGQVWLEFFLLSTNRTGNGNWHLLLNYYGGNSSNLFSSSQTIPFTIIVTAAMLRPTA